MDQFAAFIDQILPLVNTLLITMVFGFIFEFRRKMLKVHERQMRAVLDIAKHFADSSARTEAALRAQSLDTAHHDTVEEAFR